MNGYKKIIKGVEARRRVLDALSFIPDKPMISLQYRIKTGRWPNLRNPQRYTEKIQWYKLHYHNPILTTCSDKYAVRAFVEERGLGHLLNDLYAVFDCPEHIDFDCLPNSFALKLNNGSGTNVFIPDKDSCDREEVIGQFRIWFDQLGHSNPGREWGYNDIVPKITAERLLPRNSSNDIPDYKFFCFDGEVACCYVMQDYTDDHSKGVLGFFDRDFNMIPVSRKDFRPMKYTPEKPICYEEMLLAAEVLSKGFPHVRVDFFEIDGTAYFAEMTFYNASGYTVFNPDSFDFKLGEKFVLPIDG